MLYLHASAFLRTGVIGLPEGACGKVALRSTGTPSSPSIMARSTVFLDEVSWIRQEGVNAAILSDTSAKAPLTLPLHGAGEEAISCA